MRNVLVAVALLGLLGCGDPTPSKYPSQPVYLEDQRVAPEDVLEIRVYKQPDMSGTYTVGTEGSISFPLIGTVDADGKSPADIEADIRTRLADGYLVSPQVSVQVKEYKSKKVSVFGEVRKPGTLTFTAGMTIIEAISQSGGFTPRAWENAVKVTRPIVPGAAPTGDAPATTTADPGAGTGAGAAPAKQVEEFTVPVKNIANGKAPMFYVRPGDSVFVPKSPV